MREAMSEPATIDSSIYHHTFYGILNAQGQFWTPLAFESKKAARDCIRTSSSLTEDAREKCLRTHRIVPVLVRLTEIIEEPQP